MSLFFTIILITLTLFSTHLQLNLEVFFKKDTKLSLTIFGGLYFLPSFLLKYAALVLLYN